MNEDVLWDLAKSVGETRILTSILIDLAKILQELYAKEEKWKLAEWFAFFRVRCANVMKRFYLVGKYGVECVEFLKERGKLCEALEQCQWVERVLVEEFGDDYSDWLQYAPRAGQLLIELERTSEESTENKPNAD